MAMTPEQSAAYDKAIESFRRLDEEMTVDGKVLRPEPPCIAIPYAKQWLWAGIMGRTSKEVARWIPAYEQVTEWLSDNRGRGLICFGERGLGKTLICSTILPQLIRKFSNRVVTTCNATALASQLDTLLKKQQSVIYIDDLGTEPVEVNHFDDKSKTWAHRQPFCELVDACEQRGNILIVSTNLRTSPHSQHPEWPCIKTRYGERTYDRLKAITRTILFRGESMRK